MKSPERAFQVAAFLDDCVGTTDKRHSMRVWHIGSPTYLCPHFFRELGVRYVGEIFAPQRKNPKQVIENQFDE